MPNVYTTYSFGGFVYSKKKCELCRRNLKQSLMQNSYQVLWDECLRLIKANVTEQQFKTWFAPIAF
jgi:hypothetical protein